MPEICSFADPDWAIESDATVRLPNSRAIRPIGLATRKMVWPPEIFRGYSTLSRTIVKELITPAAFLPGAEVIVSLLPTISNVLF